MGEVPLFLIQDVEKNYNLAASIHSFMGPSFQGQTIGVYVSPFTLHGPKRGRVLLAFRIDVPLDQQVHEPHGQVVQSGQALVLAMLRAAVVRSVFGQLGVVGPVQVQDVVQRLVQIVADPVDPGREASVRHFGRQRHERQGEEEAEQIGGPPAQAAVHDFVLGRIMLLDYPISSIALPRNGSPVGNFLTQFCLTRFGCGVV